MQHPAVVLAIVAHLPVTQHPTGLLRAGAL
jgi:hypothetical protein